MVKIYFVHIHFNLIFPHKYPQNIRARDEVILANMHPTHNMLI